jgi:hypothetical protein
MTSFFIRGIPAFHNHRELILKDTWAWSASSAKSISGELIYFASVSRRDWSVMLAFMPQQTRKAQGHHSGGSRKNYLREALNNLQTLPKSPLSRGNTKGGDLIDWQALEAFQYLKLCTCLSTCPFHLGV